MPVVSKSTAGALRTGSTFWELTVQPTDVNEHLTVGTNNLGARAVGQGPNNFAAFYTKSIQSLFLTPAIASGTVTLRLAGRNQFDEPVLEDIVFTGTTAQQTVLCYRRLDSVTITAISAGAATGATDTLTIGYSLVAPRVPMLAKVVAGAILRTTDLNQIGTQPTFTAQDVVSGQARYNIAASAVAINPPAANMAGRVYVIVDPAAANL